MRANLVSIDRPYRLGLPVHALMNARFVPAYWQRLSELRKVIGDAELAPRLAAGELRAFYKGQSGNVVWVSQEAWDGAEGQEMLRRGQAFVRCSMRRATGGAIHWESALDLFVEVAPVEVAPAAGSSRAGAQDCAERLILDLAQQTGAKIGREKCHELLSARVPGLSARAFKRAWDRCAPAQWKTPGRPPKSRRTDRAAS
jgi:hypothetical protein